MKKYNIGLDIGTNSVGWAVVEANTQKIIKKGRGNTRKSLWGVRLFEVANPAQDRRAFRSTRRRYNRRRERIKLLQDFFENEINLVDKDFFQKLRESKYNKDDLNNKKIKLSPSELKMIKKYNIEYPTIYHLRQKLITSDEKMDIRLVYLAIHHIMKYRGNFLYEGEFNANKINIGGNVKNVLDKIFEIYNELEVNEDYEELLSIEEIENILLSKTKNDAKKELELELDSIITDKKVKKELVKAMVGSEFSINNLFGIDNKSDIKINFENNSFSDKYNELLFLDEKLYILEALEELFNSVFLKKVLGNYKNNSELMCSRYLEHKKDKRILKDALIQTKYFDAFFKGDECIYKKYLSKKISSSDFSAQIVKVLKDVLETKKELLDIYEKDIKKKLENNTFIPRINDITNGTFPNQLHREELRIIIEKQGEYYPFLKEKIDDEYKLLKLLKFRIPYYIGPLVSEEKSNFAWMERNINEKITPYNFDLVVNKELSAEKFIKRMQSKCTYLLSEYALPNNSILYCKYKVMNELKQIRVNGTRLTNEQQQRIIQDLFLNTKGTITETKFKKYLYIMGDFSMYGDNLNITGYSADKKFANNMQSFVDFFGINGIFTNTNYTEEDADEIIEWITIFEDKSILKDKVKNKYPELSEDALNKLLSKNYKGWGNLSKKLLKCKYYYDVNDSKKKSILDLMSETNENFMQIINNEKYKFQTMIKENNQEVNYKNTKEIVDELATFPAVKRGIYQALKIVNELINYMGYEPENIIIEMAREDGKKERTIDKKEHLVKLYKKEKQRIDKYNKLFAELNGLEKIDSKKYFLYFIQEGKCLYTGEPIDIKSLKDYEIDHIIPRCLIDDNSIENLALVKRECNQNKKASFILPKDYRNKTNIEWWHRLKELGLMSAKKFYNLTRKEFSEEDINDFINRQLVETRQITKHVANIINIFYKDVNVIYLKAKLVSNYREKFELFKFRDLNDYHHAHDAYLIAVLGEYQHSFLRKKATFDLLKNINIKDNKNLKYGYVINSLDNDVYNEINNYNNEEKTKLVDVVKFNNIVTNTLYRNDILVSRKTEIRAGEFYDQNIKPKGKGKIEIKKNMPVELYGGYSSVNCSYMCLVQYKNKKELVGIPIQIANQDNETKLEFIKNLLKLDSINDFTILKDKIPFGILINYKGQNCYINGYGIAHKSFELCNAYQLKLSKSEQQKYKYILNYIFKNLSTVKINGVEQTDEVIHNKLVELIKLLYSKKDKYSLFTSKIELLENTIDLQKFNNDELKELVKKIIMVYQCKHLTIDLSKYKEKDKDFSRLNDKKITEGIIYNKSITGIQENKYEF